MPSTHIILGSRSSSVDNLLCIAYTRLHTVMSKDRPILPPLPTAASKRDSQAWGQREVQTDDPAWSIRLPETEDPKENEKKQKQDVEYTGIKIQTTVTYTYRTFSVVVLSCGEGRRFGL